MKPPYDITPQILRLVTSFSEKIGEVNANHLSKQSRQLRKLNRIKTIYASLQIEWNAVSEKKRQFCATFSKSRQRENFNVKIGFGEECIK